MKTVLKICFAFCVCASFPNLGDTLSAAPQDDPLTIEVIGEGSASARPDTVSLSAKIYGKNESAKKAYALLLKEKEKLNTALNPMLFAGLKIQYQGVKTSQMPKAAAAAGGGVVVPGAVPAGPKVGEGEFLVGESISIELGKIEKKSNEEIERMLMDVIDAAKKAKVVMAEGGYSPFMPGQTATQAIAKFKLADTTKVRSESLKVAIADAKSRAETLAKLAGGKVGKILSVKEEISVDPDANKQLVYVYGQTDESTKGKNTSLNFGKIKIESRLRVKFAIVRE